MPEPSEPPCELLLEERLSGRQEDPYVQRICADGSVWTYTSIVTTFEEGEIRQTRGELSWSRTTTLPPQALEHVTSVIREQGVLDLPADHHPTHTTMGVGDTTVRVALDGREHEIRLHGVSRDKVPPLAALGQAVELAIAMALDAESEQGSAS